jgi:pimeloyl-ACP methyl ester carboxylesterase
MEFNRRAAMAAIGLTLAGCATPATGKPPIVLVHGAWHGAWCWSRVVPLLAADGHAVHAPTLPGQGERSSELSDAVDLESHIRALTSYIESRNLTDVVLVGHSYGGVVITGAADRIAARLKRLVYLDALILADGESIASLSGPAWAERLKTVDTRGPGPGLPAPPPEAFGVLDPAAQAWIAPQLTAQPLHTFDRPLRLKHEFGNGLNKTYIDCTTPAMASVNSFKARVRRQPGWSMETLACGHDAMVIAPLELATMLSRLA